MNNNDSIRKIYDVSLLYDFYGELLTEHQQKIFEAANFEDLSLSEIGESEGISRQGVHDLLKRCNKILTDYEDKLHLVERFKETKEEVKEIERIADSLEKKYDKVKIDKIKAISKKILEEL